MSSARLVSSIFLLHEDMVNEVCSYLVDDRSMPSRDLEYFLESVRNTPLYAAVWSFLRKMSRLKLVEGTLLMSDGDRLRSFLGRHNQVEDLTLGWIPLCEYALDVPDNIAVEDVSSLQAWTPYPTTKPIRIIRQTALWCKFPRLKSLKMDMDAHIDLIFHAGKLPDSLCHLTLNCTQEYVFDPDMFRPGSYTSQDAIAASRGYVRPFTIPGKLTEQGKRYCRHAFALTRFHKILTEASQLPNLESLTITSEADGCTFSMRMVLNVLQMVYGEQSKQYAERQEKHLQQFQTFPHDSIVFFPSLKALIIDGSDSRRIFSQTSNTPLCKMSTAIPNFRFLRYVSTLEAFHLGQDYDDENLDSELLWAMLRAFTAVNAEGEQLIAPLSLKTLSLIHWYNCNRASGSTAWDMVKLLHRPQLEEVRFSPGDLFHAFFNSDKIEEDRTIVQLFRDWPVSLSLRTMVLECRWYGQLDWDRKNQRAVMNLDAIGRFEGCHVIGPCVAKALFVPWLTRLCVTCSVLSWPAMKWLMEEGGRHFEHVQLRYDVEVSTEYMRQSNHHQNLEAEQWILPSSEVFFGHMLYHCKWPRDCRIRWHNCPAEVVNGSSHISPTLYAQLAERWPNMEFCQQGSEVFFFM